MIKRLFDIVCILICLLVLTPVIIVVACFIAIKLGRPVFFFQIRPVLRGKPFKMIKFRTMLDAVDKSGKPLPDSERMTRYGTI